MFICITNIDAQTSVLCTEEPMRNGPSMPTIKGFQFEWANESIYPIDCDQTGRYIETPLYYGTCDDDADTSIAGVLEVLTEVEYTQRKRTEFYARQPFPSWVFDEATFAWNPPTPCPQDGAYYVWDEATTSWVSAETA
jgi:hypothetical protein